jgi:hypothetical protein
MVEKFTEMVDSVYRFIITMVRSELYTEMLVRNVFISFFSKIPYSDQHRKEIFKIAFDKVSKFLVITHDYMGSWNAKSLKAISKLPVKERAAILLSNIEKFTYDEISYIINTSKDDVALILTNAYSILITCNVNE